MILGTWCSSLIFVKSWKVSGCLDLWTEIRNQKHDVPFLFVKSWKVSGCLDLWAEIRNQKHDIPFLVPYTIPLLTRDWNTRPYIILMKMEVLHLQLHWVLMIVQKFLTVVPCMQLLQSSVDSWSIASVISCKVFHALPPPPLPSSVICFQFSAFMKQTLPTPKKKSELH